MNSKGGTRQRTPLHYASLKINDHVDVAMILLEEGANEFARDSGGSTYPWEERCASSSTMLEDTPRGI